MRTVPVTPRQVTFTVCGQCPSLHDRWCLLYAGSARHSTTGDVYCMRAVPVTPRWRVKFTLLLLRLFVQEQFITAINRSNIATSSTTESNRATYSSPQSAVWTAWHHLSLSGRFCSDSPFTSDTNALLVKIFWVIHPSYWSLHLQGKDKIMEKSVKETHFFANTKLGYRLPVIQLVS